MQRFLPIVSGIVLGILLYVLPDMVANLGETLSFRLKGAVGIALFVASIVFEQKKMTRAATFALTTGLALTLLLFLGGVIRVAELN